MMNNFIRAVFAMLAGMQLLLMAGQAHAQQRATINPSFESNNPQGAGAANYEIYSNGEVLGWNSTTGEIELWDTNFQSVPSYNGSVHAEMNANTGGALYQNICMVSGETVGWSFAHRARSGGPATQTASFQIASQTGTLIQNLATQSSTVNNVWNVNTGSTTYTGTSGMSRVQFTTTDAGSIGNFLDDIRINLNPFVELSGSATSGVESIATANLPTLIVSGTLFTSRTVTVTITGGTATLGSDYTTPGSGSSFTVTIPPGTYQQTPVALGITIINDTATESSETIQMAITPGTGYTISSTFSCGGAAIAASTYTITDDDSRIVLTKNWVNGANGDSVSLTISGGTGAVAGSSTVGGSATNATSAGAFLQTLTLTEAFTTGNAANYNSTLVCINNATSANVPVSGAGLSRTMTVPLAGNVTCTWTNTRRSATLTIRKTWTNAKIADAATVETTGLQNDASLLAVANSANETDTNASVTVYAGESASFAESFSVGNSANYNASLACSGNATALAGTVLTVNGADTAIICTYTNARRSALLQLRKTWVVATVNNAVTLPATTGFTNNTTAFASVANTANESDTGTAVTVYAGDAGTIRAENFTTGTASSYQSVLSCTGGTLAGTNAQADNGLTINAADAGTTIVCVYTNTRTTPISVTKVSSILSDGISGSNPKAIPGAVVRYCILVTNPGPATTTSVVASDTLPSNVTFVPGSMRSGTSCVGATTVEDDDAIGGDESDPFGMSFTGSIMTGITASLVANASFAMAFNATVN